MKTFKYFEGECVLMYNTIVCDHILKALFFQDSFHQQMHPFIKHIEC
jgi:hypothetical protein